MDINKQVEVDEFLAWLAQVDGESVAQVAKVMIDAIRLAANTKFVDSLDLRQRAKTHSFNSFGTIRPVQLIASLSQNTKSPE